MGEGALFGEGFGGCCGRVCVGFIEDGGDAAEDCGAGTGFDVFFVGEAGFAEMDLGVDDAGKGDESFCVEKGSGFAAIKGSYRGDLAVFERNVSGFGDTRRGCDLDICDDEVEGFGFWHGSGWCC